MTDHEFLAALESCTLTEAQFNHATHIRAAYLYLRAGTFAEALRRVETAIRRFATSLGKSDRYHDTITVAFLTLIRQRIHERGDGGSSHEFLQKNSDLLDKSVLFRFYSRAQLESPLARCIFILPERPPAAVTE